MTAKILVVDDEPDLEHLIRQRFRRKIKDNQFEFTFAQNGVEALEKLKQDPDIDIVLSDINMPMMDGLTLVAKIDELDNLLKTVMVSAYGDMKNIRVAMNRGAYDFVTKPIDFSDLEATINKTLQETQALKKAAVVKKELYQIQQQLSIASEVQQSILSKDFNIFPENSPFEIRAEMIPAKDVGGDFYDFFLIDEDRLGLVIGDVSGKGMPAALFMTTSRTLLRVTALRDESPSDCMNQINFVLAQNNYRAMFVTVFYGILNLKTNELHFCNAGHNLPFLIDANGKTKSLDRGENIAIGILDDFEFQSQKTPIAPGNSLVLYTDGITEAMDKDGNQFSEKRLQEYLEESATLSSGEIVKGIIKKVESHAASAPQWDDITTLVIKHNHQA